MQKDLCILLSIQASLLIHSLKNNAPSTSAVFPMNFKMRQRYLHVYRSVDFVHPVPLQTAVKIYDSVRRFSVGFNLKRIVPVPVSGRVRGRCDLCGNELQQAHAPNDADLRKLHHFFLHRIRTSEHYEEEDFVRNMHNLDKLGHYNIVVDFANYARDLSSLRSLIQKIKQQCAESRFLFITRNYHRTLVREFEADGSVKVLKLQNL